MSTKQISINEPQDMGTLSICSQVEKQLQQSQKHNCQKYDQSADENPFEKFLSSVKTGNIQDQISNLLNLEDLQKKLHHKMGIRNLSHIQFLEGVQHFLERKGLALDSRVQDCYLHKLQCNSISKA